VSPGERNLGRRKKPRRITIPWGKTENAINQICGPTISYDDKISQVILSLSSFPLVFKDIAFILKVDALVPSCRLPNGYGSDAKVTFPIHPFSNQLPDR